MSLACWPDEDSEEEDTDKSDKLNDDCVLFPLYSRIICSKVKILGSKYFSLLHETNQLSKDKRYTRNSTLYAYFAQRLLAEKQQVVVGLFAIQQVDERILKQGPEFAALVFALFLNVNQIRLEK